MLYQWGRKDPFVFATNSQQWQVGWGGMYPVKIYTIDGVLIYQDDTGGDNKNKQPAGGIINSLAEASSMMETIKNPIIFYTSNGSNISQVEHTKALWDYYWTSHSRGTDGMLGYTIWHNNYLDGYVSSRSKSIYDPCPFGYKVPSNGTWNQFNIQLAWTPWSYIGGGCWELNSIMNWVQGLGLRNGKLGKYDHTGYTGFLTSAVSSSQTSVYLLMFGSSKSIVTNHQDYIKPYGQSVRCIEFAHF